MPRCCFGVWPGMASPRLEVEGDNPHRADSAALMWASDSEGEEVVVGAARPSAPSRAPTGPGPVAVGSAGSADNNGMPSSLVPPPPSAPIPVPAPTPVPASAPASSPAVVRTPSPRRGPAMAAAAPADVGDSGGVEADGSQGDLDRRLRGQWRSRMQLRNQQAETAALYRWVLFLCC